MCKALQHATNFTQSPLHLRFTGNASVAAFKNSRNAVWSLKEKECAQICWHAFHMLRISYNATCIVFTMSTLDSGFVWCTLNAHYVYIWDRVDREQCKQLLAVLRRLRCPSYYSTKLRALQSSNLSRKYKLAPQSSSSSKGKHRAAPRGAHTDLKSKILRQLLSIAGG